MGHLYVGMQFGLFMAAFIFFAHKGGAWLDQRFDTYPLFSLGLVLLAVVNSFVSLMTKMDLLEKYKKKKD